MTIKIAVIPGDGIGPEVTNEALKVLEAVAGVCDFKYELTNFDFGGERYLRTGEVLPDSAIEELKRFDVIYLGAIGHPDVQPGILEKGILLKIRFELDQYINLRPIKLYPNVYTPLRDKGPEHIDLVIVRENTEGLYLGSGGNIRKGTSQEVAIQEMVNTRFGVERCIRYAFELTSERNKDKKLTLCDKANVLTFAHGLWSRAFEEVGKEYSDIKQDHAYVDATTMWMVKNPEWFDVIVTCNMFGDIIADLGAMIQGGMGIAASGNLNPGPDGVSMFEPIHGSAPKYKGQNKINPLAAIGAMAMLLKDEDQMEASRRIENAITRALSERHIKDLSAGGDLSTTQIGDLIARLAVENKN